jgi:hypothetical protein
MPPMPALSTTPDVPARTSAIRFTPLPVPARRIVYYWRQNGGPLLRSEQGSKLGSSLATSLKWDLRPASWATFRKARLPSPIPTKRAPGMPSCSVVVLTSFGVFHKRPPCAPGGDRWLSARPFPYPAQATTLLDCTSHEAHYKSELMLCRPNGRFPAEGAIWIWDSKCCWPLF